MKKIIISIVVLVVVVGGGAIWWWNYYNSPGKILDDAVFNALQTSEMSTQFNIKADHLESAVQMVSNYREESKAFDMRIASSYNDEDAGQVDYAFEVRAFEGRNNENMYLLIDKFNFKNPLIQAFAGDMRNQMTGQWVLVEEDKNSNQSESESEEGPAQNELFEAVGGMHSVLPFDYREGNSHDKALDVIQDSNAFEVVEVYEEDEIKNRPQYRYKINIDRTALEDTISELDEPDQDYKETLDIVFSGKDQLDMVVWIDKKERRFTQAEYVAQLSRANDFLNEGDLRLGEVTITADYRYTNIPSIEPPKDTITEEKFDKILNNL